MAKITFKGLEGYTKKLEKLPAACERTVFRNAVYKGAEVAADAVRQELSHLPTDEKWGTPEYPKIGPSEEEKDGLLQSFGITPIQTEKGVTNAKLGFDGYQGKPTPKYPKGLPNQLLARCINSGTSFMFQNEFMKRAIARCRKPTQKAMIEQLLKDIYEEMK